MNAIAGKGICPNCFSDGFNSRCRKCGYTDASAKHGADVLPCGYILHNRYLVGRVLGIGGFGISYLALDVQKNQKCAIKEYFPSEFAVRNPQNGRVSPRNMEKKQIYEFGLLRFLNEIEILKIMEHQPNVVTFQETFQEHDTVYLVMEYIDGASLKTMAQNQSGRIPYQVMVGVMEEMIGALEYIHTRGFLHRDISPDNILTTPSGESKLIDFGAAMRMEDVHVKQPTIILRPGFAPPEQYITAGTHGPWSDIYSLCATAYVCVTGRAVPSADKRRYNTQLPSVREIVPNVPIDFSNAIQKGLSINVTERQKSMAELARELSFVISSSGANRAVGTGTPYMRLIVPGKTTEDFPLSGMTPLVIGRNQAKCNVTIDNINISREHVSVAFDPTAKVFRVRDMSSNGTYFKSGVRLERNAVYNVKPGQELYLSTPEFGIKVGLK